MKSFMKKMAAYFSPSKNLVYISLAFWVSHIILRILLLFRSNPYGFPFVSKPDWYIFHAVCIDFLWISNALLFFVLAFGACKWLLSRKQADSEKVQGKLARARRIFTIAYIVFHSVVILFTLLDNEVQRFLGSHLTFGLTNTYKDASSIIMFWDYVANDFSVPYLQFFVLVLILPFTYGIYRLLSHWQLKSQKTKATVIAMLIFYVMSYLFVYVIWTGNARMTKLRPFVSLVSYEILSAKQDSGISEEMLKELTNSYQKMWSNVEGDSSWQFAPAPNSSIPLYRVPTKKLLESQQLQAQRAQKPNFIVIFMESHRGLNTGFLNPGTPSPTPFLDSLAHHSRIWERMHASGLPTTGGVLSTHIGIPHHSKLAQATDLAHVSLPSFASILTDSGYVSHYFSAADPAWDNLGVWMSKWYTAQHYDRNHEDDSTFFDEAITYVNDSLAKQGKPFLATFATRSNHYPFNFAAGMTEEDKQKPLTERIKITMNYADRQVARFIHAIEKNDWYQNTYLILLADHAFPLGENGVSTMNGGAFSNATWIPFIIHGKGIEAARDTATAAQIDIAPTILELAGIAAPNIFMGHNLLRGNGNGLSLGAYAGHAAIGFNGYRLIQRQPLGTGEVTGMFRESDTHQNENLVEKLPKQEKQLTEILESLIKIADYSLEHGM